MNLKEKGKTALKELVRRGLDGGTERLRSQFREAAQRAGQATCAMAKAAAKANVAAIKAAITATQELIATIAAGGWAVLVMVLMICIVGLLIASPFGIFFADGGSSDAISPTSEIAQINSEYTDRLSVLQNGGTYDQAETQSRPPACADVFAVFAVRIAGAEDGESVAVLEPDTVEKLRAIPPPGQRRYHHGYAEDAGRYAGILQFYRTAERRLGRAADGGEQCHVEQASLRFQRRDRSHGAVPGGQRPYWSWYGFNSRVEWCACFVSWCAKECGYIDAGVIPQFAGCTGSSNWFRDRGQ